ncbi:MAG: hypothetical protein EOL97_00090 [Spirochaetia bacterium]|nr:hypothetical protein [Spirochaetia bacterium]
MHIPSFQGGDYHTFIKKDLKFRDIDKFKNKKEIYTYLNSKDNSYQVMIGRLRKCKYLSNIYSYNAKEKDVYIKRTIISKNNECQNGSNIEELFDLINTIIS